MTTMELVTLHEVPCRNTQFNMMYYSPMLHYNPDKYAITEIKRKQITLTKRLGSGAFGMVKIHYFKQRFTILISRSIKHTHTHTHRYTFFNKDMNYMNFCNRL